MEDKEIDNDNAEKQNKDAAVKPDQETLHTTDPQEHMEGPLSSLLQMGKDKVEDKGGEKKVEKDEEKKED